MEVLKRKCTSLFEPPDRKIIIQATKDVHNIVSEATHLLKAYYLQQYESLYPTEEQVVVDTSAPDVSDSLLSTCCLIVQGVNKLPTRVRKPTVQKPETVNNKKPMSEDEKKKLEKKQKEKQIEKENKVTLNHSDFKGALQCYEDTFPTTNHITTKLSLSYILAYSVEQTMTAYNNNIIMHFPKYVKKYIYCTLLNALDKPKGDKQAKKEAALVSNHVLYDYELKAETSLDIDMLRRLLIPVIAKRTDKNGKEYDVNRLYDLKSRPWVYLQRMVWMNRAFESSKFSAINPKIRKLYNPLSLISTLVPGHIRLDTSGIGQLLMTKKKIEDFVKAYKDNYQIVLKMENKADMLSSYNKLTGKSASDFEKAEYATRFWQFICKFGKKYKDVVKTKRTDGSIWVFDNAVATDGYSISFQITTIENFKRKDKFKKAIELDESVESVKPVEIVETIKVSEFHSLVQAEADTTIEWWNKLDDKNQYRLLANDPGKSDIMYVTDGLRKLRYTKGMRDQETHKKARHMVSKRLRDKGKVMGTFETKKELLANPSVHDFETKYMSETCKKSCIYKSFIEYWKRRRELMNKQQVYDRPFFRQAKFLVYTKTKSSERKFFNKLEDVFLKPGQARVPKWMDKEGATTSPFINFVKNQSNKSDATKLLIGWGDWGRSPNLKGSAPTPGIGLRRRAAQRFETITIPEAYTSKTCPCCQTRTLINPKVGEKYVTAKHHLLRCTNDDCMCSWWNRNVTGSFNIMKRFVEGLQGPHCAGTKPCHTQSPTTTELMVSHQ